MPLTACWGSGHQTSWRVRALRLQHFIVRVLLLSALCSSSVWWARFGDMLLDVQAVRFRECEPQPGAAMASLFRGRGVQCGPG